MPHEIDVLIGSRIRSYRKFKNISQEKLGAKLGLTFQQIQKYESGSNRIGMSRFFQIAEALEVSPLFFLTDCKGKSLTNLSREESAFLTVFNKLYPEDKQLLLHIAKSLHKNRQKRQPFPFPLMKD